MKIRGKFVAALSCLVLLLANLALTTGCGDDGDNKATSGTIAGTVVLEDRPEDASGVLITIGNRTFETTKNGSFEHEMPAGQVLLSAQKDGYVAAERSVDVIAGETVDVAFTLATINQAPRIDDVLVVPAELAPGETATVTVEATDPNGDPLLYYFEVDGGFAVESASSGASPDDQNNASDAGASDAGAANGTASTGQAVLTAPEEFGAQATLTVTVEDSQGERATKEISVTTSTNQAPVIEELTATATTLAPGAVAVLHARGFDADNDELTYQWDAPAEWTLSATDQGRIEITAPDTYEAVALVTVRVTDPYGAEATATITLETSSNNAPQIVSIEANPPQTAPGESIILSAEVTDPDGQPVTLTWTAPAGWIIENPNSEMTKIVTPDEYDASARVSLEVVDAEGEVATGSIVVSTTSNEGPQILGLSATPNSIEKGGEIVLNVQAGDPNGDELTYNWDAPSGWTLTVDSTDPQLATLQTLGQPGESASILVTVTDAGGATASASTTVSTKPNTMPAITALNASATQVLPGDTVDIAVLADDADGDTLTYTWSAPSNWNLAGTGPNAQLTAPGAYDESATISVTVADGFGGTTTGQLVLSTANNQAPIINDVVATPQTPQPAETFTVAADVVDPNGDSLTYTWTSAHPGWTINGSGDTVIVDAPMGYGVTTTLTVLVEDTDGKTATKRLLVTTAANEAPVINLLDASPSSVRPDETLTVTADATDPNGDTLAYTWSSTSSDWTISGSGTTIDVQAPSAYDSSTTIKVVVDDGNGMSATGQVVVSTSDNSAPVIADLRADTTTLARAATTNLFASATDADGDSLTYSWTITSADSWTITGSGTQASVTAADRPDSRAVVELTVDDGAGGTDRAILELSTVLNSEPTINSPSNNLSISLNRGRVEWSYQVEASDADGDTLTYSLIDTSGLSISVDADGEITWTPARSEAGSHVITLKISDGYDTLTRYISATVSGWSLNATNYTSTRYNSAIAYGDFDGDGATDVVTVHDSGSISVALAEDSSFDDRENTYGTRDGNVHNCSQASVGDVDGQNGDDVVVSCGTRRYSVRTCSTCSYYHCHSYDSWGNCSYWHYDYYDCNCRYETRYAHEPHQEVYLNNGDGTLRNQELYRGPSYTYTSFTDSELVDLNADGHLDLIAVGSDDRQIYLNDTDGTFTQVQARTFPGIDYYQVDVADMDGVAGLEAVVTYRDNNGQDGKVTISPIDASGSMGAETFQLSLASGYPEQLALVDLDADGDLDAVVGDRVNAKVYFVTNDAGSLTISDSTSAAGIAQAQWQSIDSGDLDADGNVDVVLGSTSGSDDYRILFGDGAGQIDEVVSADANLWRGLSLEVSDQNGDGLDDIIVWDSARVNWQY